MVFDHKMVTKSIENCQKLAKSNFSGKEEKGPCSASTSILAEERPCVKAHKI
jgi:hypothetical protein